MDVPSTYPQGTGTACAGGAATITAIPAAAVDTLCTLLPTFAIAIA